jgi:hypothetical protein
MVTCLVVGAVKAFCSSVSSFGLLYTDKSSGIFPSVCRPELYSYSDLTGKPKDSTFSPGFNAFFKQAFKYPVLLIGCCIHTISPGLFGLRFLQPVYIAGFIAAKPKLPYIKGGLSDFNLTSNTFNSHAGLLFLVGSRYPDFHKPSFAAC